MTTKTRISYPRPTDVGVVVRWLNEGEDVFLSPNVRYREHAFQGIKEVIARLDLPEKYEAMRVEALGNGNGNSRGPRYGQGPSEQLRDELRRVLRLHSYLYAVPSGWSVMVPMTGRQLHILRLTCSGWTTEEISQEIGNNPANVRERLRHMRDQFSCTTTAGLISMAYRKRWLPDQYEMDDLVLSCPKGQLESRGFKVITETAS